MEVRKGFKQTDIGVIPEDWDLIELRSECDLITKGTTPTSLGRNFSRQGVNFIKIETLDDSGKIIFEKIAFIDEETNRLLKRSQLKSGDILFSIAGALGRTTLVKDDILPANTNQALAIIRLKSQTSLNHQYLNYYLTSNVIKKHIEAINVQAAQANLSLENIGDFKIISPPIHEQQSIAAALSDVDSLLTSLDALIAKKRLIKQGAMQELLTGKKRLPGFEKKQGYKQTEAGVIPEDWKTEPLGKVTTLMTNGFVGPVIRHYAKNDDGVLYIQGYNVEENAFNFHGIKYVTEEFHRAHMKSCLREGDLLTIQTGEIGLTTIVPEALAGSNCHALIISRFDKKYISSHYVSFYLNSKPGRARLKLIETGTTMKHLNVGDMLQFTIPLPPTKEEQTAIAEVLSDMDAEITTLEARREKTRLLKQGIMQELLTGRIRLV